MEKSWLSKGILLITLLLVQIFLFSRLVSAQQQCSSQFDITYSDRGSEVLTVCLSNEQVTSDGNISADVTLEAKTSLTYGFLLSSENGVITGAPGSPMETFLRIRNRAIPLFGKWIMPLGRVSFSPGAHLRIRLDKIELVDDDAPMLLSYDVVTAFLLFTGIGHIPNKPADVVPDIVESFLELLNNVGFDSAVFTQRLRANDWVGAMRSLARMFETAPDAFAAYFFEHFNVIVSPESVRNFGKKAGRILPLVGVVPLIRDLITKPRSVQVDIVASTTFIPSNGKVAYSSFDDRVWQIYVMNADGSNQQRITQIPTGALSPVWSPDGRKILFISQIQHASGVGVTNDLYIVNTDGTNLLRLAGNTSGSDWSPDSTKIVFASDQEESGHSQIYIVNADGSNQIRLIDDPVYADAPNWSPDGSKIAYRSQRDSANQQPDGLGNIYVVNPDGSNQVRVTSDPGSEWFQDWSPDNQKIVYVSWKDGNSEIYSLNIQNMEELRLTNDPGIDKWVTWSPNGQKLAFTRQVDNIYNGYVMNADGSEQVQLTSDPPAGWSPDSNKIIFWSLVGGIEQIYTINVDGTDLTNLTNNLDHNRWPSWTSR
jgi:Tol biopolymer transport system component